MFCKTSAYQFNNTQNLRVDPTQYSKMKVVKKSYKFRIYPNKTQQAQMSRTFGCVRFVWNQLVDDFNNYNKEDAPTNRTIPILKEEFGFLSDVSCATLQQKQRDFIEYKSQFFNNGRKTKVARPVFKKKGVNDSFRLPSQKFKITKDRIQLERIGKVKAVFDRQIPRDVKFLSVTVKKNSCEHYFASVLVNEKLEPKPTTGKTVGIDLGLKTFIVTSDNQQFESPKFFRKNHAKLARAQMWLSKKKKGSKRRQSQKKKVARIHLKTANQRQHFIHQVTNDLIDNYQQIVIEDLNVKGMVKNRKLAKSISDASFAMFRSHLTYKCKWHDRELVVVDRFYPSSKTCSGCGSKKNKLNLKERIYVCESCGFMIDRDFNAALNLKVEGLRLSETNKMPVRVGAERRPSRGHKTSLDVGLNETGKNKTLIDV